MPWDPLPHEAWEPTIRSLHRWSQVIGKIRLGLAAPVNHWWHITLYVSPHGLTTSAIPYGRGAIEFEMDLRGDVLRLRSSDTDREAELPLRPMAVSEFYAEVQDLLARSRIEVAIYPVPVEMADATPFMDDTAPGGYDPEHARALHGALLDAQRVLTRFRSRYIGKASPVHFFWGGFDLATTRFSGRSAPRHPGGVPNCPDWVMAEAYSHEVSSAGWWPGTPETGPAFYAYMYPEPAGYPVAPFLRGRYDASLGDVILPDAEVRALDDPDAAVLEFLQSAYTAGADLSRWDRGRLERAPEAQRVTA